MASEIEGLATALAALLEREAQAIGTGRFEGLEGMAGEKAALAARLGALTGATPPALPVLQALARQAAANQRRLGAALKGLRAARQRLDTIRRAGCSLQSYDAFGRGQTIAAPACGIERRA